MNNDFRASILAAREDWRISNLIKAIQSHLDGEEIYLPRFEEDQQGGHFVLSEWIKIPASRIMRILGVDHPRDLGWGRDGEPPTPNPSAIPFKGECQ